MRSSMSPAFAFPSLLRPCRIELSLRAADGEDWVLTVSPGIERFIGVYARLPEFGDGSGLLAFRAVATSE